MLYKKKLYNNVNVVKFSFILKEFIIIIFLQ